MSSSPNRHPANIHHDNPGQKRPDQTERLAGVAGLATDFNVRLLIDQVGEPLTHQRMVIHQQNFSFRCMVFSVSQAGGVKRKTARAPPDGKF